MPYLRPWSNVELIKDSGLIPYLFAKKYGFIVYMIGKAPEGVAPGLYGKDNADVLHDAYPYYDYVKDMNLLLLAEDSSDIRVALLEKLAPKADLLILRGFYESNIDTARIYKVLNPAGKIYCGLDMNSTWLNKIDWHAEKCRQFFTDADIIATSSTAMAACLSEKWSKTVYTITNGTYDFDDAFRVFKPFSERENIILTVGRLGTAQKATEVLVEAFLKIEEDIPDWRLELVGSETDEFRTYLENIYKQHPSLRTRIIETGPIVDRKQLFTEYKKAKIFALPSRIEGGTPNAAADAISAGLAMAVTKIDAYRDMTDDGACGLSAEIDDVDEFAENLKKLCLSDHLEEMGKHAFQYSKDFYSMDKNVEELYALLFGDAL